MRGGGTPNFGGGLTTVGEEGWELVELPRGTKVHSHKESMQMVQSPRAYNGGQPETERHEMTRQMYDAVTPAHIPSNATMVAGYVDGKYAWRLIDWLRFARAVQVRIAVFPSTNNGHVLDVERGDATPAQAPPWVLRRRAAGVDPTVYCSLAAWPAVRAAFASARVREPHYWIAAYPGNGNALYPGAVAHQYADPGPFDVSIVADVWPGIDVPRTPTQVVLKVVLTAFHTVRKVVARRNPQVTVAIQRAVHVVADGKFGPGTLLAGTSVINHKNTSVSYLQARVGTKPDGTWGPASQAAWVLTIKRLQSALGVKPDGAFGPVSTAAWKRAVAANFNKF